MDKRLVDNRKPTVKPTPLPDDYLAMVGELFTTHFDEGLRRIAQGGAPRPSFAASGAMFGDEIMLAVSLLREGEIRAITAHASVDFDPKASSPTAQDLLSSCVDALGAVFERLLDKKDPGRLEAVASGSTTVLDGLPILWAPVEAEGRRVFVRLDRTHPGLDQMAEAWLAENDPEHAHAEKEAQAETEALFITGRRRGGRPGGHDGLH